MAGEQGRLVRSLEHLAKALDAGNGRDLKGIGGDMGENALVENDPAFAEVSIIAYCCYKVIDTPRLCTTPQWEDCRRQVKTRINAAIAGIAAARREEARDALRQACAELDQYSLCWGRFQNPITVKARTKLAADLYAHGASLGRACDIAGADKREVLPYVSATKIPDKYPVSVAVQHRLGLCRNLFGGAS